MKYQYQQYVTESFLQAANQNYLDDLYSQYLENNNNVPALWQEYFKNYAMDQDKALQFEHNVVKDRYSNFSLFGTSAVTVNKQYSISSDGNNVNVEINNKVNALMQAYRQLGHLVADINPLSEPLQEQNKLKELEYEFYDLANIAHEYTVAVTLAGKTVNINLKDLLQQLKLVYTKDIGFEFMHIASMQEREYLEHAIEATLLNPSLTKEHKTHLYEMLVAAEGLERFLGAKYPGAKRFSLEGCDSLIILLDRILFQSASNSFKEAVLCMAHRGRLNVLVNILGKMPSELFDEFEGKYNLSLESGDVKYHQGFSSDITTGDNNLHLSLAFNPSHLEIVTPVSMGSTHARQQRRKDVDKNQVIHISMHGDAAFSGQGVVMETLNMSQTRGYGVGGAIRVIINNQIGFTTHNPKDARSTRYCSDIGKMIDIPIFHVNADAPEAVFIAAGLALDYKIKFKKDVIINLIGYRRLGHNEADEPAVTQPLMYNFIKNHPTVLTMYGDKLVQEEVLTTNELTALQDKYRATLEQRNQAVAKHLATNAINSPFIVDWTVYTNSDPLSITNTTMEMSLIKELADLRDTVPTGFQLHPRVLKIVNDRQKMTKAELAVDWGYAETLAYASLLHDGINVRLSGQDCGRGTFFHRHVVWHDKETGKEHVSLQHLYNEQGNFNVINSLLSEEAVLAFEYGYSSSSPRELTIWEAQFGDFVNGAQVVIDQFMSSGEQKWGRLSGLVLLLPHGYEGQGPEHSSARIERFMQLCAENNMQVCVPSTAAQIFHLLRRQILKTERKPLVVITPKSLLRHKGASSTLTELSAGCFYTVIDNNMIDSQAAKQDVTRIILCSGKVYYDLLAAQTNPATDSQTNPTTKSEQIALIRIEQLYPFPTNELITILKQYPKATTIIWCQEEPKNQGAWFSIQHNIKDCLTAQQVLSYAGRDASAAPAVGSTALHQEQQTKLIQQALGQLE